MAAELEEVVVDDQNTKEIIARRRKIYMRPFYLYTIGSFVAEVVFLIVGCTFFSGWTDMYRKIIWTLLLCPVGMGAVMGSLTNQFITDYHYGRKAAIFSGHLALLVLGTCNMLCFNLDHHFHFFGASTPAGWWWFNLRYPVIWFVGYNNGKKLFTEEGQKELEHMGI